MYFTSVTQEERIVWDAEVQQMVAGIKPQEVVNMESLRQPSIDIGKWQASFTLIDSWYIRWNKSQNNYEIN